MAGSRLGFDIGSNSMKISILQGDKIRMEQIRMPENLVDENSNIVLPNAFIHFLKQTRKKLALPRGKAVLVLPPGQVICRFLTMPKMTAEQLILNLPYEFADFIQGVPDQYYCDYAVCDPDETDGGTPGIPIMAAVAEKRKLSEYIRIFSRAGIPLKVLIPQEMALIRLVQEQKQPGDEFCFVDLGHLHTRITVVRRDRIQATRQIGLGGRNLDLAVAEELGVDAFLANSYKTSDFQGAMSIPAFGDICEQIAVEILKVINFYQFTYRSSHLEGIYLAGGGASVSPLRQAIERTVGMELLDPAELFPEALGDAASGIFAAGAVMGGKVI